LYTRQALLPDNLGNLFEQGIEMKEKKKLDNCLQTKDFIIFGCISCELLNGS
jgi:hypothetical protein